MPKAETPEELEARRDTVASLHLRGFTQVAIAEQVRVSRRTVLNDLEYCREIWVANMRRDLEHIRAEELGKLDAVEWEYWQAWRRSIGEITEMTESTSAKNGDTTTTTTRTQAGDPRYLQGIERCIAERCDILGLRAPERHEITQSVLVVDAAIEEGV
jgi:hypothetical protein